MTERPAPCNAPIGALGGAVPTNAPILGGGRGRWRRRGLGLVAVLALTACATSGGDEGSSPAPPSSSTTPPTTTTAPATTTTTTTTTTTRPASSSTTPRPSWLGTRVLPVGPDGVAASQPTPPELVDRRFATIDVLPPPTTSDYEPAVGPVPDDVVARSTWSDACPVSLDDLRYVQVPFWGFDERLHTGELLVNADAVEGVLDGFAHLFAERFPIEAMTIATRADLDAPPTGDGNTTGAFVCRPTRGATSWSQHAYGRAVDINPFQNPYVKGDRILPELATSYATRSPHRAGMLTAADVSGFLDDGWGWGGQWSSLKDNMHVSVNGR